MKNQMFVRNDKGLYKVKGLLKPEDVVSMASDILYKDLSGLDCLVRPTDAAEFLRLKLAPERNEVFAVLFLDNKHRVQGFEILFKGTIDGAAVYPRVVAERCLHYNSAAVILSHNHPSGECTPSEADRLITKRLSDALSLIDVRVLDHLVVGSSGWTSLAERGWL